MTDRDWPRIVARLRAKAAATPFAAEATALRARADELEQAAAEDPTDAECMRNVVRLMAGRKR